MQSGVEVHLSKPIEPMELMATAASLTREGRISAVDLTIKDSGTGFDPHEAMRGPGLGLTSMKERLKVWAGRFPSTRSGARHDDSRCRAALCPNEVLTNKGAV